MTMSRSTRPPVPAGLVTTVLPSESISAFECRIETPCRIARWRSSWDSAMVRSASVSNIRKRVPGSVAKALATGPAASVRSHAKPAPAPMNTFAVFARPLGGDVTSSVRFRIARPPALGQILLILLSGSDAVDGSSTGT